MQHNCNPLDSPAVQSPHPTRVNVPFRACRLSPPGQFRRRDESAPTAQEAARRETRQEEKEGKSRIARKRPAGETVERKGEASANSEPPDRLVRLLRHDEVGERLEKRSADGSDAHLGWIELTQPGRDGRQSAHQCSPRRFVNIDDRQERCRIPAHVRTR